MSLHHVEKNLYCRNGRYYRVARDGSRIVWKSLKTSSLEEARARLNPPAPLPEDRMAKLEAMIAALTAKMTGGPAPSVAARPRSAPIRTT